MSFQFKQFSVDDDLCAMKIGTDGCLLGAWADVEGVHNILDIGAGSGVVSLMLAQRSKADVDAVEIDKDAWKQCAENFDKSPWKERLHVIHSPLQEYVKSCKKKYDLIVSSPPYFVNSMKTACSKRKLARHTDSLTFEELISGAKRLMNLHSKFCVIIPSDIVKQFLDIALIEGFYTIKKMQIEPKAEAKPLRTILQMELIKKPCEQNNLAILDKEGKLYTSEYIGLTKDFYINF
ncbi:MAG: methyltransferase [Bacteroidetes bacterium]|nr:methyltransferase [Bacteroidota bacterium]